MKVRNLQPQLTTFEWGEKRRNIVHLHQFISIINVVQYRIERCEFGTDSLLDSKSITVNVGLDFCKPVDNDAEVSEEEIPMVSRINGKILC